MCVRPDARLTAFPAPETLFHCRNMPKAMRQRLNKYERTRMSNKALRCLRLKIWGAGVRPMRRVILTSPLDPVSGTHTACQVLLFCDSALI